MVRAAERLGLEPGWVEVAGLRERALRASHAAGAMDVLVSEQRYRVEAGGFTHAVSYGGAGIFELAVRGATEQGHPRDAGLWDRLGLTQVLWWTDHPNWACRGAALAPEPRSLVASAVHVLKSDQAAREAAAALGWAGACGLPVAEDYDIVRPVRDTERRHDVVAIVGGLTPVPTALARWLRDDDPEPAVLDRAMIPEVLERFRTFSGEAGAALRVGLDRWASAMLEARAFDPQATIFEHALRLRPDHAAAMMWLERDPQRWYAAQQILRLASGWRRSFWLAWLARRVELGIYGADASVLGLTQPDGAATWVAYEDQSRVYNLGRCALTINQSHDEAGVTHKPFQIVASGVPCVHHASAGLSSLFDLDREMFVFARGPQLLDAVDRLCADPALRDALADRALARAKVDHTWDNRIARMLDIVRPSAQVAA
jgi:hypothetical protein